MFIFFLLSLLLLNFFFYPIKKIKKYFSKRTTEGAIKRQESLGGVRFILMKEVTRNLINFVAMLYMNVRPFLRNELPGVSSRSLIPNESIPRVARLKISEASFNGYYQTFFFRRAQNLSAFSKDRKFLKFPGKNCMNACLPAQTLYNFNCFMVLLFLWSYSWCKAHTKN